MFTVYVSVFDKFVVRRLRHPHNLRGEEEREVRDAAYTAESQEIEWPAGELSSPWVVVVM